MSDIDTDFEDFEDNSPAGLRKALEKAKRDAKKAREELAAERDRAAKAEQAVKKSTLTELLSKKGAKPGLAKWLEKDDVEATPEAVDAWLKENGEFFNVKVEDAPGGEQKQEQEPASQGDGDGEGEQPPAGLPPELVQALAGSQQLDASGVSPSEIGVLQRIASVSTDPSKTSWDQMVADIKAAGVPTA